LDALLQGEREPVDEANSTGATTRRGSDKEELVPSESLAFPSLVEKGFLSAGRSRTVQRDYFFSALAQILDEADFPSDVERLVQELVLGSAEGICERMERQLNDV
jgi:hypothetical protein